MIPPPAPSQGLLLTLWAVYATPSIPNSPSQAGKFSIPNLQHIRDKAVDDADVQKQQRLDFFLLTLQLSNCKTQMCCQLEHTRPHDPPPRPPCQLFHSVPGLRTCKEAGVSVRLILLVDSFQDDMACTIGLIIPSSLLLKICPQGQSFILFVLISPETYQWKSITFALCWLTLQGYNYSYIRYKHDVACIKWQVFFQQR